MAKNFQHPYDMKTARWIRQGLILEKDVEKRKEFLGKLVELFPTKSAEVIRYISADYRVMIRDDQMWADFDSPDWVGAVWSCGRAYGKALRNDQLVGTPMGFKPIGDIVTGETVLTRQGGLQKVVGVYPQGVVDLFKLTTWDGRETVCCKDHLWTGRFGNRLNPFGDTKTITTSVLVDHVKAGGYFYIPQVDGSEDVQPEKPLPIDPYVLGVLLGDGNMTERHVCLSTSDEEIVIAIRNAGYEITKWKSKYEYGVKGIIGTLKGLNLQGKNSHTKFIPEIYMKANYSQRLAIFQGLMDTDGCISKVGQIEFSTTGHQLQEDFQKLAWSLGFNCKVSKRVSHCNGKSFNSYRIAIQAEQGFQVFRLERHLSRVKNKIVHGYTKIVSYENQKSSEATCIKVDGEESLFVTDNYLVTHNTWAGSPACIEYAMKYPNCRIGLIAPTFGMGRTNMIEGSSGIIKLSPKGFKPKYNRSDGTLAWSNGATAKLFSAENGDRIRGENFHYIWSDEFCFCKFTGQDDDFWKMAKMALRAGDAPKYTITTSPRPIKALRDLYEQSKKPNSKIRFHTGTTFDNYSLPQSFIDEIKLDEGTSLYNQEVLGMILEENLGAIFSNENILRVDLDTHDQDPDKYNDRMEKLVNSMDTIVVSVDPNVVEDITSDETGVVVCGRKNDKGYVFKDASGRGKISDIYKRVVSLYHQFNAECVVVETNNGGDFIPAAIFNIDPMVVVEKVFASRGKRSRAEPIGLLYERKKIYHVGIHRELEIQMTDYNPQVHSKSPDRLDALVWSFTKLFPASMRGLFNNGSVENTFHKPKNNNELEDLHAEVYAQAESAYNPYSLDSDDEFDADDDFSCYL